MFKRYRNDEETTTSAKPAPSSPYGARPSYSSQEPPPRIYETPQTHTPQAAPLPTNTIRPRKSIAGAPHASATTNTNVSPDLPDTTLGEGVVFKGELTFQRLLRIDGQFEGELESEGKLIVGRTGVVKSHIKMREAIIEGRVEGNITVTDRLELRSTAHIQGDIEAGLLSVDEGVVIVGHVKVHGKPEKREDAGTLE